MLSKTLIVCLLAFLCLNIVIATRLNTRIAGPNGAKQGQFPYIAFLYYNYMDGANPASFQFTGIIYSATSVVTAASNFDNFQDGSLLVVEVGAWDANQPLATYQFLATIGKYDLTAGGTPPPDLITIPTQYQPGNADNNVATVRIDPTITPNSFDLSNPEVKVANFPTSSPLYGEQMYAVAYGNQASDPKSGPFPILKFVLTYMKKATVCQTALSDAGKTLDRSQQFCVQSKEPSQTNDIYNGICRLDVGGAIVRTTAISDPTQYYEVVGIIADSGDDSGSCDPQTRLPAVILYLSEFQDSLFTPVLGSLSDAGNGQDATKNPRSARGNFICGNGIVEGKETCDPSDPSSEPCCSENTCTLKKSGKYCDGLGKPVDTHDPCNTRPICDAEGACSTRPRSPKPSKAICA